MTIRAPRSKDKITKDENLRSFTDELAEVLPKSRFECMNLRQLF